MKSRVRLFEIPRTPAGFGLTFRGDCPVYVRSVDFDSLSHEIGVRSGDLLLEINGIPVRYSSKHEVLELLKCTTDILSLVVVVEGLQSETLPTRGSHRNNPQSKEDRAKHFHEKVNL